MAERVPVIAISLGGTKTAIGRFDAQDQLVESPDPFPSESRKKLLPKLNSLIDELSAGLDDFAIGIAVGAPFDQKRSRIGHSPGLLSWEHQNPVADFEDKAKGQVYARNDAQAGALAEWGYGAGQGEQNMVFLTCGTGMGGGVIAGGHLVEGHAYCAGEVGHIPISSASRRLDAYLNLEDCMSGRGFVNIHERLHPRLKGVDVNQKDFAKDFAKKVFEIAGEPIPSDDKSTAEEIIKIASTALGEAIAVIANVLNPKVVIIGGIYARQQKVIDHYMLPAIEEFGHKAAVGVVEVRCAKLREKIDYFQALAVARYARGEFPQIGPDVRC